MKKRIISLLLAMVMILGVLPVTALADSEIVEPGEPVVGVVEENKEDAPVPDDETDEETSNMEEEEEKEDLSDEEEEIDESEDEDVDESEDEKNDESKEEFAELDLLENAAVVFAAGKDEDRNGTGLIFRRFTNNNVERVISASTGSLQDVLRKGASDFIFTLEKIEDSTTTIDGTVYFNYRVTIEVGNKTYYMTSGLGLTTNENSTNVGTFLIKTAKVSCHHQKEWGHDNNHSDRLCLFLVKGNSYSGYWGQAVEFETNGNGLTLCAQNEGKKPKTNWDVCCDAYDLEEAAALITEYKVTITKAYKDSDGNALNETAAGLTITLTKGSETYTFKDEDSDGIFTCSNSDTLPEGTYNISETGTDINGYTWVSKDMDSIEIPVPESSTQSLFDTYKGCPGKPVDPGDDDDDDTDDDENKTSFVLTNTYTKDHVPVATSATKKVVCDGEGLPEGLDVTGTDIRFPNKNNEGVIQPILIEADTKSVTLLYKITVEGEAGASFKVTDEDTELVYPKDNSIGEDNGVYTGKLTGTSLDFYVKKTFSISKDSNSGKLTNEVKLDGKKTDEKEVPYEKKALVTITKDFTGDLPVAQRPTVTITLTDDKNNVYELNPTGLVYSGRVPAGTYTVSEGTTANVEHYNLIATLTGSGETTVDEKNPFQIKVENGESYTYTLTNNYTKQQPKSGTFDPAAYIVKTLTGDELPENMQFTVTVTRGSDTKTGTTASAKMFKDAAFTFDGTFELAAEETEFTVKETKPATVEPNGLQYDTNIYTLKVKCEVNPTSNTWEIDTVYYKYSTDADTEYRPLPDGKLVISNSYTKPEDPARITSTKWTLTKDAYEKITVAGIKESLENVDLPDDISGSEFTYVVPENTKTVTFAYCVKVTSDKAAEVVVSDDASYIGFISKDGKATVDTTDGANNNYKVKFTAADTADLYFTKTFNVNGKGSNRVWNTATVNNIRTPSEEGTIKKAVSVNFSDLIQKKLTITGDYKFTGATFYATLTYDTPKPLSLLDRYKDATYKLKAEFGKGDKSGAITEFVDKTTGEDLTIDFPSEGTYTFWLEELEEVTGDHSGVKYDDSVYKIKVKVKEVDGVLRVDSIQYAKDDERELKTLNQITFKNTINTGKKGSTIKIDSPNKLNTDDHFAYIIGYPDGTVQPNGEITRAEVATIFFRLLKDDVRDKYFTKTNDFSDVNRNDWFNNPVSTMAELGIVKGYPDGTFRPNAPITRAEFAAIAARFDESSRYGETRFTDVAGHWAIREIAKAYNNSWIKGYPDNTFRPNRNITRAEAMTLINRVLNRAPETEKDLLNSMNKWSDNLDVDAWYYLAVQEATNSHDYRRKTNNYEHWLRMLEDPNWAKYER